MTHKPILCAIIITWLLCSGFAPMHRYRGVMVFNYRTDVNSSQIDELLDTAPSELISGVTAIYIFQHRKHRVVGEYVPYARFIRLYRQGFDGATLEHELAHYCQELRGQSVWIMLQHDYRFKACEAVANGNISV